MNKMYLILGDWSDDGHGKSDKILVEVNKSVKEIQDAYKASCKLTGISFNHNEDFTELNRNIREEDKYRVVTEADEPELSNEVIDILKEYKCPVFDNNGVDIKEYIETNVFVELWFWFVSLSLSDLEWKIFTDNIPCINGYWNTNLNVQFGYGLY